MCVVLYVFLTAVYIKQLGELVALLTQEAAMFL